MGSITLDGKISFESDFIGNNYNELFFIQSGTVPEVLWNLAFQIPKLGIVFYPRRPDKRIFDVFTPMSQDGKTWIRWGHTNMMSPGAIGCPITRLCQKANLYNGNVSTLTYNSPSRTGTWANNTYLSKSCVYTLGTSNETVTYSISGTGVAWWFGSTISCGIVYVIIKDNQGNEINSSKYTIPIDGSGNHYVDCYPTPYTDWEWKTLAKELTDGNYTVEIKASGTKNASSDGYRIYDAGIFGFNESQVGTPGTHPFLIDLISYLGGGSVGPTVDYIANVRPASSTNITDFEWVSGAHGYESNPDPSNIYVTIDNVSTTLSSRTPWTLYAGTTLNVKIPTQLATKTDPTSYWANLQYEYLYDYIGQAVRTTRTTITDISCKKEVCAAWTVDTSNFPVAVLHNDSNPITMSGSGTDYFPYNCYGVAFYNNSYISGMMLLSKKQLHIYDSHDLPPPQFSYSSISGKLYLHRMLNFDVPEGRILPSGTTHISTQRRFILAQPYPANLFTG